MTVNIKGRTTVRRYDPMQPQRPRSRTIPLWEFDAKPDTTLAKLEAGYVASLDAVDQLEQRKVAARNAGTLTDAGVNADALTFATSKSLRHCIAVGRSSLRPSCPAGATRTDRHPASPFAGHCPG
jgi:hypothetical protein